MAQIPAGETGGAKPPLRTAPKDGRMTRPKAPCENCPDRRVGCHGTCEKYIAFQTAQLERTEKRRADKELQYLLDRYEIDAKRKRR